ncbi:PseG/SpsG family protein [Xenorhabdus bovienii]|uniref:Uncharacterized protein n=1 Tax=Xenorhabdus bovienii TaxID=40576 RepID=A0A0B6XDN9_XENBV|nr:hypothetical protein [Xenorhabdus bovienii]CDM90908.1 protein of unknown function [Xenorhabdus bovienii]
MGHAFRVADLSKHMAENHVNILCTHESINAFKYLKSLDMNPIIQEKNTSIYKYIKDLEPDLIINDTLDTEENYINSIKKLCDKIITFEDMGDGVKKTDITINAVYSSASHPHVFYGHEYIDLRDEFISSERIKINYSVRKILLSFGGEDPNNLTLRFLKLLTKYMPMEDVTIIVITGPAYSFKEELINFLSNRKHRNIEWIHNIKSNISKYMLASDIAIVSNGRTVYELAALGIPSISISSNEREDLHNFPEVAGFFKLGLHSNISDDLFIIFLIKMLDYKTRLKIHKKTNGLDLKNGKKRIKNIIYTLLKN